MNWLNKLLPLPPSQAASTELTLAQSAQQARARFAKMYPEVKFEKLSEFTVQNGIVFDIGKVKIGHLNFIATLDKEVQMVVFIMLLCKFGDAYIEAEELLDLPLRVMTALSNELSKQM